MAMLGNANVRKTNALQGLLVVIGVYQERRVVRGRNPVAWIDINFQKYAAVQQFFVLANLPSTKFCSPARCQFATSCSFVGWIEAFELFVIRRQVACDEQDSRNEERYLCHCRGMFGEFPIEGLKCAAMPSTTLAEM